MSDAVEAQPGCGSVAGAGNASDLYEISNLQVLVWSRRSGDDGKNEGKAGLLLSHLQQVLQVGGLPV